MLQDKEPSLKQYLLISDFDQTLSFHDSGLVLSEMLGISGFLDKINGLSQIHLVQQGGEGFARGQLCEEAAIEYGIEHRR